MQKNIQNPIVSIVLPVYNAELFLAETLDSILRQTFSNFEVIAINDGSTDSSLGILKEYAKKDARIVIIDQKNMGLVKTLNSAISSARGTYIARVDADDPSFENRLELQVEVLDKNSNIVLVGGGFEIIDENGFFIETVHAPTREEDIRRAMLIRNPFGHAGVMFTKKAFKDTGGYSDDCGPTEDYDLWVRLSHVGNITSIPQPLYRYRIVQSGISQSASEEQAKFTKKITENLWKKQTPRVLSRQELLVQANRYLHLPTRESYNVGIKVQFLSDNARIGTKLIRHAQYLQGIKQLLSVASVGRSGIKAVVKQLGHLDRGSFKQLLK
jgi:glycosyltransferase involved in cell wall biosynthesis